MNIKMTAVTCAITLAVTANAYAQNDDYENDNNHEYANKSIPEYQSNNPWFTDAVSKLDGKPRFKGMSKAKNVILFVGDGMGVSTVTAARILEGQLKGMQGEENNLSFDVFPYTGMAKTYNVDSQTPDSAGTMTAMMSGVKTDVGVIGVDEDVVRGDCSTAAGNELVTALDRKSHV